MIYELIVVGGGVWGTSAARTAVELGVSPVLLLEKKIGLAQEASAKSGGILTDLLWNEEDRAFVARSRHLYQEAMRQAGDVSIYRPDGMLTLADAASSHDLLGRTGDLRDREIPFEVLDRATVAAHYPVLDRLDESAVGLLTPHDAHVNPTAYAEAAAGWARERGLTLGLGGEVTAIGFKGSELTVTVGGEILHSRRVLVAAGSWTRKLIRTSGLDLALRPYRVQLSSVHLDLPHRLPILWHIPTDVYTVPEGEHDILAGDGTRLFEHNPDDYQTTGDDGFHMDIARGLLELTSLGETAGLRSSWAGLVGGTPDRRPHLGALAPGLFVAAGDNGIGVMRGPAIGELAAKIALGEAEAPSLFRPDRFPDAGDFPILPGFTLT